MTAQIQENTLQPIRVKFLNKSAQFKNYVRQLPENHRWGNCEFIFDQQESNYDWLVVYDDLPARTPDNKKNNSEILRCPEQNTLLLTVEPSNIKTYGRTYVKQFGYILTSQEPWALHHDNRIYSQPALRWFYGIGKHHQYTLQELRNAAPPAKTKIIATVCSSKQQKHTLHNRRYNFTQDLKALLPELDIFGRGVREIDDKAESLDPYKYHVAIENHIALHHWTEKLSDAFLGYTLPFYSGCPNLANYFPEDSFIRIDINDVDSAYKIISEAIKNNEYEKRLDAIKEARRLVIEKYSLFAVLADNITRLNGIRSDASVGKELLSRHAARRRYPVTGFLDLLEKGRNRIVNRFLK